MIEHRTLLLGHTSPETAYVVEDYPYGFRLRCKIRYWIETAQKGAKKGQQRFMSQTTNPKKIGMGEVWNKPKASTYYMQAWLYLDGDSHVQHTGVGMWVTPEQYDRYRLNGVYDQMPENDRKVYNVLTKIAQRDAISWQRWSETIDIYVEAIKTTGEPPVMDNGTITKPGGGGYHYVGTANHELATALAHERIAQIRI